MLVEHEFRKSRSFPTFEEAKKSIRNESLKNYIIYYLKSYRLKLKTVSPNKFRLQSVEIKKRQEQHAVFFDGTWFRFVTSFEFPYRVWNADQHKKFAHLMGLDRKDVIVERRSEVTLSKDAKIYAFSQNEEKFGLVFELESRYVNRLRPYKRFYDACRDDDEPILPHMNFDLPHRKPVSHVNEPLSGNNYFKAVKHDGIHGFVYCLEDCLWERWEDNVSNVVRVKFCPGVVFAAEKMSNGTVVLLDVVSVKEIPVYRKKLKHVLIHFLSSLKKKLPSNYQVQTYYSSDYDLDGVERIETDGIIFHRFDDVVFKLKSTKTVELLYENGFLRSFDASYPCSLNLVNGRVYECKMENGTCTVIKERSDRFICNTTKQIENALS
jgi:hypothetical protein